MTFQSVDPTTGDAIASYPDATPSAIEATLARAHAAHLDWRDAPIAERSGRLLETGRLLRARRDEFARTMTHEMGKPITQAIGEVEKCAWVCDYYAEHAEAMLAPVPVETDASVSYWTHRPLGVVLGIMPWNFPFWQVVRFAAPTLAAGNAALLKHAPNVPGCALALESLFAEAGYPSGLFANLFLDVERPES